MKNIATPPKLEIAGLKDGRDITRPFIGPLLYPLDTVLRSQNHDYKVYTALLRDSQLFACLQQRIAKLIACETIIDAASDSDIDVAAADFLRNMLNEIGWDAVCERMLYAIFFGFSIAEIQWAYRDGHHTIDQIDVRSQERFRFDTDLKPRLITSQNWQGDELPDRKFWTLTFGGHRSDEPYGLGLAHQLYWLVYFKRNGMKSWLKFLDRFGHPLPLVKYGANATDEQKQQALEIALSLAEDSAAAAPEGLVFELVETARSGTADYTELIALLDSGISKIILSQTMTTDSGSSRSQAEVHGSVADAIVKSDADLLCESFNRTIGTWVTELNFPGATPPRMYRKTQADQDLKTIVDRDKVLFDMGYAPNTEYIVETFGEGFRPPEKGEASPIALNGAQVTALTTTISQAISDGWIPELAVATIRASFPTIGADLITAIAEQLQAQVDKSAELSKPQEAIVSPEQAAAQFGEVETTADFAAKKAPKGKKDCQKGKICKGSCIAKTKTCLGDMNPAQLKAHKAAQASAKKAKAKGGGGGAAVVAATVGNPVAPVVPVVQPIVPPVAATTVTAVAPTVPTKPETKPIDAKTIPTPVPAPKVESKTDDELYNQAKNFLADSAQKNVAEKIDRIRAEFPQMTKAEANAIATWIGTEGTAFNVKGDTIENYRAMNMGYYNSGAIPAKYRPQVDATNKLLESAYKKLPQPSIAYIQEKSLGKKPPVTFDPNNNLTRSLEFTPAQAKAYVQKYRDSIGKEVTENYHLAATHLKKLDWAEKDANVQLSIKPRYGEKGQAKYVDYFKNKTSEGELIYPPGSKFKILGIREIDPMKDSIPKPLAKLPAKSKQLATLLAANLKFNGVSDEKGWQSYKNSTFKNVDSETTPANVKMIKAISLLSYAEMKALGGLSQSTQKKYIIDMEEA